MVNGKISVIIPAYNIENTIIECLESVVMQTYTDLEIIIVDDGSNDNTFEIINNYALKDSRIKVIHKENGGVTSARITGIKNSTGDYIGFVDGDDYIDPNMYQLLLDNMLKYNADIAHCGYKMVFPKGKIDLYYGTGKIIVQDKCKGVIDLLEGKYVEPALFNKLFRRELFSELLNSDCIDFSIKVNEDLLMNYYLFSESQKSIYEDRCLYHYIVRKGSAVNSEKKLYHLLDPIKVTRVLLNESKNNVLQVNVLEKKLVRQLVSLSTIPWKNKKISIVHHRKGARRELRELLPKIIIGKQFELKLKIMAVLAAYFPLAYRYLHIIYARTSGIDKKYSLDQ